MTLLEQLLWGSLYLCICLILETGILVWCVGTLSGLSKRFNHTHRRWHTVVLIMIALGYILFAHTLQVWIWSAAFMHAEVLSDWNTAVYFSLVTYTTVGYGDVVLGPGVRIFAAFAGVTGLLGFGISTAFLVGAMGKIFSFSPRPKGRT